MTERRRDGGPPDWQGPVPTSHNRIPAEAIGDADADDPEAGAEEGAAAGAVAGTAVAGPLGTLAGGLIGSAAGAVGETADPPDDAGSPVASGWRSREGEEQEDDDG